MFIERPSKTPPDSLRSTVAVLHSLGKATAPASDNVAYLESALSRMRLHGVYPELDARTEPLCWRQNK